MDNNDSVALELENVAKRGQKNNAFGIFIHIIYVFMNSNVNIRTQLY